MLAQRGGYLEPFLGSPARAREWQRQYVQSIVDRDVGRVRDVDPLSHFLSLFVVRSGALLHAAGLSRQLGLQPTTVRACVVILERLYLVRALPPWHHDAGRRLVRTPTTHAVDGTSWTTQITASNNVSSIRAARSATLFVGAELTPSSRNGWIAVVNGGSVDRRPRRRSRDRGGPLNRNPAPPVLVPTRGLTLGCPPEGGIGHDIRRDRLQRPLSASEGSWSRRSGRIVLSCTRNLIRQTPCGFSRGLAGRFSAIVTPTTNGPDSHWIASLANSRASPTICCAMSTFATSTET